MSIEPLLNKVYNADARELLRCIPTGSVDAVITDPMFGTVKNCQYDWGKDPGQCDPERHWAAHEEIYRECLRVLKPGGRLAWAQGVKFVRHFPLWFGGHRLWTLTRFRIRGQNPTWHIWVVQTKDKRPIEFPNRDSIVFCERMDAFRKYHPCPKPVEELALIVESLTAPGDIVLDCFCGVGSTLIAAQQSNRRWIGCDISRRYCQITMKRLDESRKLAPQTTARADHLSSSQLSSESVPKAATVLNKEVSSDLHDCDQSPRKWTLHCARVEDFLPTLPSSTFDAAFLDGPYGLGFMEKTWDGEIPSKLVFEELRRVCKPGVFVLAFGGTKTFHRLACNIEDAGWEVRDVLCWLYGEGFPKGLNVSKAIDKASGVEPIVISKKNSVHRGRRADHRFGFGKGEIYLTRPASAEGKAWLGYSTQLKPGWEPIILAQAPRDGSFVDNCLRHGCGALNIDGCRIGHQGGTKRSHQAEYPRLADGSEDRQHWARSGHEIVSINAGRWPANVLLDETAADQLDAQSGTR